MIRPRAREHTLMPMVPTMRGNGQTINSTDMELKAGLMVLDTRANIWRERKKAREDSLLLMEVFTRVNSAKMKSQDKEITFGLMENLTQATGQRTKWTDKAFLPGEMERSTRVSF